MSSITGDGGREGFFPPQENEAVGFQKKFMDEILYLYHESTHVN